MLHTSYFAKQRNNKTGNLYSITVSKPSFFNGKHFGSVSPSADLVFKYKKGLIDEEGYTQIYLKFLDNNEQYILSEIAKLPEDSILLCYEGPGKFCHRHVLADWLKKHCIDISEI